GRGRRALASGELAGPLHHAEGPVQDGDPGRVVAAIFEPAKPFHEDGKRLVGTHVANDPAHEGSMVPPGPAAPTSTQGRRFRPMTGRWPAAISRGLFEPRRRWPRRAGGRPPRWAPRP